MSYLSVVLDAIKPTDDLKDDHLNNRATYNYESKSVYVKSNNVLERKTKLFALNVVNVA